MRFTLDKYFRQLNIMTFAMALGVIIFALLAVYLNGNQPTGVSEENGIFYAIILVMAVIGLFVVQALFKHLLRKSREATIEKKLMAYKSASIIRLAFLEGISLFGIVIYLITNKLGFLVISALCIFAFRFFKASKEKMRTEVPFSTDDIRKLNDSSQIYEI